MKNQVYRPSVWAKLLLGKSWRITFAGNDSGEIRFEGQTNIRVEARHVTAIQQLNGIIWTTLIISSGKGTLKLEGLSGRRADTIEQVARAFINGWIDTTLARHSNELSEFDRRIQRLVADNDRYLARADISKTVSLVGGDAADALAHPLFDPKLLRVGTRNVLSTSIDFLTNPKQREQYNARFLREELERFKPFFDSAFSSPLTSEQREACIRLEDANLLVAAAGSGKTATMVAKVAYLVKKNLYPPDKILVLAFNTDAAAELRTRTAALLGVDVDKLAIRISTFHALGRDIIKTVKGAPPQLANWVEHPAGKAGFLSRLIDDLLKKDPEFATLWKDLLLYYPKADRPIASFESTTDYQRYIEDRQATSGATVMTLVDNLYVRSLQEQRIANWLWEHKIPFEYEKQIDNLNGPQNQVFSARPDFYYPQTRTFHEHLAIKSNGSSPFDGYEEKVASKRMAYEQAELDYFETTLTDAASGVLTEKVEKALRSRGIEPDKRPVTEVLKAVPKVTIRRYHTLLSTCIQHIRSAKLTPDMLNRRAEELVDTKRAKKFIELVVKVTDAYEKALLQDGTIDFDSMIGDATELVGSGQYESPFELILVDEFQDISPARAGLIRALKNQQPFTKLFTVGDDWQAIYRFAGSDITLFTEFESEFGDAWVGKLQTTFRSNQTIATAAAEFIKKNPQQVTKSITAKSPPIEYSIRAIPVRHTRETDGFSPTCYKLLNRLSSFANEQKASGNLAADQLLSVLVLGRYNHSKPDGGLLSRDHLSVQFMTFHRAKGLEADYVILMDVSEGDYGVPSQIEDDELLNLVIPQPETFPYAEERRLFYVALTRASRGAFVLFNQLRPSRYLKELSDTSPEAIKFQTVSGSGIKICSKCRQGFMVPRQRKKDGGIFMGCTNFPACENAESMPTRGRSQQRQTGARRST